LRPKRKRDADYHGNGIDRLSLQLIGKRLVIGKKMTHIHNEQTLLQMQIAP